MNKLEVGMFVKFKDKNGCTYIRKVIDGYKEHWYGCKVDKNANNVPYVSDKNIINYSFNIIDLIEVGDYVNYHRIEIFYDTYNPRTEEYEDILGIAIYDDANMDCISEVRPLSSLKIYSIVTKEQFEQMKYEVE
mgnify:CR=1 FL=1